MESPPAGGDRKKDFEDPPIGNSGKNLLHHTPLKSMETESQPENLQQAQKRPAFSTQASNLSETGTEDSSATPNTSLSQVGPDSQSEGKSNMQDCINIDKEIEAFFHTINKYKAELAAQEDSYKNLQSQIVLIKYYESQNSDPLAKTELAEKRTVLTDQAIALKKKIAFTNQTLQNLKTNVKNYQAFISPQKQASITHEGQQGQNSGISHLQSVRASTVELPVPIEDQSELPDLSDSSAVPDSSASRAVPVLPNVSEISSQSSQSPLVQDSSGGQPLTKPLCPPTLHPSQPGSRKRKQMDLSPTKDSPIKDSPLKDFPISDSPIRDPVVLTVPSTFNFTTPPTPVARDTTIQDATIQGAAAPGQPQEIGASQTMEDTQSTADGLHRESSTHPSMPSTRSYSQALQGHGHGHGQPLGQDSTLHQHSGSLPIRNRGREETLPRRDFDFVQARREDEELFEAFMEDMFEQEDEDPRQRFVIRFRYKGRDPYKLTEKYMVKDLLLTYFGLDKNDILAVIMPPGLRETDVCLVSQELDHTYLLCPLAYYNKTYPKAYEKLQLAHLSQKPEVRSQMSTVSQAIPEGEGEGGDQGWQQVGKVRRQSTALLDTDMPVRRSLFPTDNRFQSLSSLAVEMKDSIVEPATVLTGNIDQGTKSKKERPVHQKNVISDKGPTQGHVTIDTMSIADLEQLIVETKQKYDQVTQKISECKKQGTDTEHRQGLMKRLMDRQLYLRDRATVITCEIDKRKDDESARWNPGEQEGSEQVIPQVDCHVQEHLYPPPFKL
ncbi:UNVERIFIED_CONTAM: hypothetical protein K2H54_000043 [Gekko kuhli]